MQQSASTGQGQGQGHAHSRGLQLGGAAALRCCFLECSSTRARLQHLQRAPLTVEVHDAGVEADAGVVGGISVVTSGCRHREGDGPHKSSSRQAITPSQARKQPRWRGHAGARRQSGGCQASTHAPRVARHAHAPLPMMQRLGAGWPRDATHRQCRATECSGPAGWARASAR